jgi:hypothetical protein
VFIFSSSFSGNLISGFQTRSCLLFSVLV